VSDSLLPFFLIARFVHIVGYRLGIIVLPLITIGRAKVDDEDSLKWYEICRDKNLKIVVSLEIGSAIGWVYLITSVALANILIKMI